MKLDISKDEANLLIKKIELKKKELIDSFEKEFDQWFCREIADHIYKSGELSGIDETIKKLVEVDSLNDSESI